MGREHMGREPLEDEVTLLRQSPEDENGEGFKPAGEVLGLGKEKLTGIEAKVVATVDRYQKRKAEKENRASV